MPAAAAADVIRTGKHVFHTLKLVGRSSPYKFRLNPQLKKKPQKKKVMDQLELYERDVMWPESQNGPGSASNGPNLYEGRRTESKRSASAPVSIPAAGRRECGVECIEDEEVVPPHVLASRRRSGDPRAAFSVCSGLGRTLKGRDLRLVRNSVLRMTGYLEG